jgi:hypothetical protein
MLVAWRAPILRATRDIDLLACTRNDPAQVQAILAEICRQPVPQDGLLFDAATITTERITEDADYEGVRARFRGQLATTRLSMQIDMGFGDVVTPHPIQITYPTILDHPAPVLLAYNRETAIAEKYEAMISLGRLNSRMKDFFDIWLLATTSDFHGAELQAAISATFRRRATPLTPDPEVFGSEFAHDASKQSQWAGFLKRMRPSKAPPRFPDAVDAVRALLEPIHAALAAGTPFDLVWKHPGPWKRSTSPE